MDKIDVLLQEKSTLRNEVQSIKSTLYGSLFTLLSFLAIVYGFLLNRQINLDTENLNQIRLYFFIFNQIMFLVCIYAMSLHSSVKMLSNYLNIVNKEIRKNSSLKSELWEEFANPYYYKNIGVQHKGNVIIYMFFSLIYIISICYSAVFLFDNIYSLFFIVSIIEILEFAICGFIYCSMKKQDKKLDVYFKNFVKETVENKQ